MMQLLQLTKILTVVLVLLIPGVSLAESIVVGLSRDVNNWNPARTSTSVDGGIIENIYEKLVDFDREGNPIPALAISWESISPGVWEFRLRPNVRFTNGEPFNAAVVKHNLEFQRDDVEMGARSWLQSIVEVEIIDDLTVHIHTNGPAPELVNALSWTGRMIPLEYGYTERGYSYRLNSAPVGTGPYRLVEWVKDNRIVLEYNEEWWGPEPEVKRVEIRILPEAVTRTAALLSGEVDFIDNPNPEDIDRLRRTSGIHVAVLPAQRVAYLFMDSYREFGGTAPERSPGIAAGQPNPLMDARVRKAIYQAIDRELIADALHEGLVIPAYQIMLPTSYAFNNELTPPAYNPEEARQLLAEAGYENGFALEIISLRGRLPRDEETILFVASQLREIGIDASVRALAPTVAFEAYAKYDVSMGLQSWGALTMPGMSWEGIAYGAPERDYWGRQNHGRFSHDGINALINELAQATDLEARVQLFQQLGQLFMEEFPVIPLFYTTNIRAMKNHLIYDTQGVELIYYKDIDVRR